MTYQIDDSKADAEISWKKLKPLEIYEVKHPHTKNEKFKVVSYLVLKRKIIELIKEDNKQALDELLFVVTANEWKDKNKHRRTPSLRFKQDKVQCNKCGEWIEWNKVYMCKDKELQQGVIKR